LKSWKINKAIVPRSLPNVEVVKVVVVDDVDDDDDDVEAA
jgi:hypothetical protein